MTKETTSVVEIQRPKILGSVLAIAAALAGIGIGKERKNVQQGYNFRGIDEVLNVLARLLAENGVIVLPSYRDRVLVEYESKGGGRIANITLTGEFKLVSAADGSTLLSGPFIGEAMDTADKATNKAMSAAYKYFAIQTFAIPTTGDNDADTTTHVVQKQQPVAAAQQSAVPANEPVEDAIVRLAKTKPAREKLTKLVTQSYGVVLPEQVPADKVAEAVAKMETYVAAQITAAAKKKTA